MKKALIIAITFLFSFNAFADDEVACAKLLVRFFSALGTRDAFAAELLQKEYKGKEYMPCQFVQVIKGQDIPKMYFGNVEAVRQAIREAEAKCH